MSHDPFRYAKPERERRFLAPASALAVLSTGFTRFEDLYIDGTQLRLRAAREPDGSVVYKLTQKLQQADPTLRMITTIYASEAEYRVLAALPGARLAKRRHRVLEGAVEWGVDVFEGGLAGLLLAEIEASSDEALRAIAPPSFAPLEVTRDAAFTGGALAGADPRSVLAHARELLARGPHV